MMGVSKATVSRALSGNKGVGPELRKKIIAMADELNYQPNTLAQSLAKGRLNIIALIVEDIRNPFYAELAFYIQSGLSKSGYMLMVLNSESNPEKDLANLYMVSQSNFAGLFLLTIHSQTVEQELYKLDIPVVLVNRTLPSYQGSCVLLDNFQAGYQATLHLIELNHRKIGFIRGPRTSSASYQRYLGYRQAIQNFGISEVEAYFAESDLTLESGRSLADWYLCNPAPKPSAMIISNDHTAIGFIDRVKKKGVRIPEDLSVVSFDNIAYSVIHGIELTTIDPHVSEICSEAVRLMLKQLHDPDSKKEKVIIAPTIFVRKTTIAKK